MKQNNNNINFVRNNILVKNLVLIDGIGRAGKFFLGKIVSGFENIEHFQYASIFEQIPYFLKLGSITEDAAITLLQSHVDEYYFYMQLGRNLNLRLDDATSLHNSLEKEKYIKRSQTPYSEELKKGVIENTQKNMLFVLHETMPNISIYFKTHPEIKIIHLIRHPIDLIYSWYKQKMHERVTNESFNFWPNIMGNDGPIPWFANDWKDEFETISGMDLIIKCISHLIMLEKKSKYSFSNTQKKQVLTIKYEDIVENTHIIIKNISQFLNCSPLKNIDKILKQENCPNQLSINERDDKKNFILSKASPKYVSILNHIIDDY